MHSTGFSSTFLWFSEFSLIRGGKPNFLGGTSSVERLNYLKNLKDPDSWLFIRFPSVLHDSVVLFSDFQFFFKFKRGDLISWGELILQNGWINCPPPSPPHFSHHLKDFLKFERGDLISWGNPCSHSPNPRFKNSRIFTNRNYRKNFS